MIREIADYISTGIVYYIAGVTLHEFSHYKVANLLGYEAVAHFPTWISGFVDISPSATSPLDLFLIGIAGGLLTCLFFLLVSIFTNDTQTDIILGLLAPVHGFYAFFEVLYLFGYLSLWIAGTLPDLLAAPILFLVIKRRIDRRKSNER